MTDLFQPIEIFAYQRLLDGIRSRSNGWLKVRRKGEGLSLELWYAEKVGKQCFTKTKLPLDRCIGLQTADRSLPGTAAICLLSEHMTVVRQRIDVSIPRKRKGGTSGHERVSLTRGFDRSERLLSTHPCGLTGLTRQWRTSFPLFIRLF